MEHIDNKEKEECECHHHGHHHEHGHHEHHHEHGHHHGHGHEHEHEEEEMKPWRPALSFILLIAGILLGHFQIDWFSNEYIQLIWYIAAFLPVG